MSKFQEFSGTVYLGLIDPSNGNFLGYLPPLECPSFVPSRSEPSVVEVKSMKRAQRGQVLAVRIGVGGQGQAHPVQRQRTAFANGFQGRQTRAAGRHVVLGMDLEPQPLGVARQGVVVVLGLEAKAGGDHGRFR